MGKIKISIIVPVYKVEKYLHKCIDSILCQSFTDFEVLLIDDESPDNSGKICDNYATKDNRIQVVHKKNEGVSAARNTGLKLAKGEWITFIDSDDWIEDNYLQICIDKINKYELDLLQVSYRRINNANRVLYQSIEETGLQESELYISTNKFLITVWGGFFKKNLIQKQNLKFDTSLKLGEDQLFIYKYILSCNRCMRIKDLFYNYRYNNESATATQNPIDCINSLKSFQNFPFRSQFEQQIQKTIYSYLLSLIRSNKISNSDIYHLIKHESFNLLIPHRKIDSIFLSIYKISRPYSIKILSLLKKKI